MTDALPRRDVSELAGARFLRYRGFPWVLAACCTACASAAPNTSGGQRGGSSNDDTKDASSQPSPGGGGSGGASGTGGGPINMPGPDGATAGSGGSRPMGGGGNIGDSADTAVMPGVDAGPVTYPQITAAMIGAPVSVSSAFSLAESPIWDHCKNVLLFVDVDAQRIHQLAPPSTVTVFQEMSNYTNGISFDSAGNLWRAEMGGTLPGRITRMDRAGMVNVIADKNATGGALHTPDDLVIRSDGTVYFTDPTFPHGSSTSVDLFGQLGILRISPESAGFKVTSEATTTGPNGIELSPDEKSLYVDSFFGGTVLQYDVAADGSLKLNKTFASGLTNPDSLCVDAAGDLYVGVSTGLRVFTPDGAVVTKNPISSSRGVTNSGIGGSDGKTLYISAWTTLWRVDGMPIPGLQWQKDQQIPCP